MNDGTRQRGRLHKTLCDSVKSLDRILRINGEWFTRKMVCVCVCVCVPYIAIIQLRRFVFVKPPPPVGAGYMFSGRPSVPLSVRP